MANSKHDAAGKFASRDADEPSGDENNTTLPPHLQAVVERTSPPIAPVFHELSAFPEGSNRKQRFLIAFVATAANFARACVAAQVARRTVYCWLDPCDRRYDSRFAVAYAKAETQGAQVLEDECRRRAFEGVLKGVYHRGLLVDFELEYSDRLAEQLLKAHHSAHRDVNITLKGTGKDGAIPVQIVRDEVLAAMPEAALLEHIRVLREAVDYVRADTEFRVQQQQEHPAGESAADVAPV